MIITPSLTGAFDSAGHYLHVGDNSALLDTIAFKEGNNLDITANRLASSAVEGLSGSEQSVGQALNQVFGTGALDTVFPQLFTLNNADYAKALNALGGAEFAQLDQSVLWSTGQINSTITDRMDCGANWAASASGEEAKRCFVPGKVQTWARIHGSWNNDGGDANAPGYGESQFGVYGGADYALPSDYFVGIAAGYFSSDMSFDDWTGMGSSSINYSGFQGAAYGGYDDGHFYARGIGSVGFYTGDSHRLFGLNASPLDPSGNFDASVESFYGEAGRRYSFGPKMTVTPFLGVDIAHSDVGGFSESPTSDAAALNVGDGSGNSVASVLGARVEGHWGAWTPEVSVAWEHEFLDPVLSVNNAFAAAPGVGFTVQSSDPGRDWAVVGLGTTYSFTPTSDLTLKYDGRFASGYSSSSVVGRWDVHF